ncbi:MAG: Gfo/Idh/MocA family oxidoreductase [Planctomycetales bacterium]|nr:Gfo/Idh/MocA family oxidoreductase [Planctomycetales bacterium]
MSDDFSRRQFMTNAAKVAAALPVVASLPTLAVAAPKSPNEKLDIACIGVAGQGNYNLRNVESENIVALCDVDSKRMAEAAERHPHAKTYTDYRQLLDKEKLDAVVIATPDHSHAIPAVWALQKGLDVYCEKPLAHNVYEVRKMREWAKKQNAVTQMGTQIHAGDNYRRVVELVQAGVVGPVRRVHVWMANIVQPGVRVTDGTPPDHVDYDLWIGPAPMRPFHASHFHFNWRYWWDFGGGTLGDFGCHYMDLPFWALGLTYPTSIDAQGKKTYEGDNQLPDSLRVDYQFPARDDLPPVHMTWYHGDARPSWIGEFDKNSGVLFEGERGRILADYGSRKILMGDGSDVVAPEPSIANSIGHHQEWILACKERSTTTCNFDYSGALAESVLLGNVAYRSGNRFLAWDAENLIATNCPEASNFIQRTYRDGWKLEM